MSEMSEIEIKSESDIEEQFHAVIDSMKYEEMKNVDTEPPVVPEYYGNQRSDGNSEFSEVVTQITRAMWSPLRCRLCAVPDDDTTDIFESDATGQSILEKINRCLPVVVKETDNLPRRVCQFCLEELDRCYQFYGTVAKAEKLLLTFDRLAFIELEETESNCETLSLCDEQRGPAEYDDIDGSLDTTSYVEMDNNESSTFSVEETHTEDTTAKLNIALSSLKPCSVVLIKTRSLANGEEVASLQTRREVEHRENLAGYGCISCAKRFTTKSNLKRHRKLHTGEGLYSCEYCEKKFTTRAGVDSHRRVHTKEQSFKCSICELRFIESSTMRQHMSTHSADGNLPVLLYRCTTCARTFKSKAGLMRHNKIHTGKGIMLCQYCGKKFTNRSDRDRHHRIHTDDRPFNCSLCKRTFKHPSALRDHASVHSDERKYSCSLCKKSFKTVAVRNSHMKIHTSNRPQWQCSHCQNYFVQKRSLRNHSGKCKARYPKITRNENRFPI